MSKYTEAQRAEVLYDVMRDEQGDHHFVPKGVDIIVNDNNLKRYFLGRKGYSEYRARQTAKWLVDVGLLDYHGRNYKVVDVNRDFPPELHDGNVREGIAARDGEFSLSDIFTNRTPSQSREAPSEASDPVERMDDDEDSAPSPVVESAQVAQALAEAMWRRYDRLLVALGDSQARVEALEQENKRLRELLDSEPLDTDQIARRILGS